MARLADTRSSKDNDAFGTRPTSRTTTETLTLVDALGRVADGRMGPTVLFFQLSADLRTAFDKASDVFGGGSFMALPPDAQKQLMTMFRDALSGTTPR